jgi:hypothetical protein
MRRFAGSRAVNCSPAALGGGSSCSPLRQDCGRAIFIARRLVTRYPCPTAKDGALSAWQGSGGAAIAAAGTRQPSTAVRTIVDTARLSAARQRWPINMAFSLRSRWTRWPKVVADHPGSVRASVSQYGGPDQSVRRPHAPGPQQDAQDPPLAAIRRRDHRRSARPHLRRIVS